MNHLLTVNQSTFNIISPLPHEAVGTTTPELTGQKRPLSTVVFLCSSKIISTRLIRIKFFMVGCIRHPLGWLVPVASCSNLIQSATQRLLPKAGGYIPNTGETAMRNHNQKLTSHVSQLFFSLANKAESRWWQQYIDRRQGKREALREQGNDYKSKSILSLIGVGS